MEYEDYEKIIEKLEKEEIAEFLLDSLMSNSSLRDSFEITFCEYCSDGTKDSIKELLYNTIMRISDRGYIDDETGSLFMDIMYDYANKAKGYIEKNDIKNAINIVESTLETIGEFYIDGSNGEHGDVQDMFLEIIEDLLSKSSASEKEQFLIWLKEYIEVSDEFVDYKDEFKNVYDKYK